MKNYVKAAIVGMIFFFLVIVVSVPLAYLKCKVDGVIFDAHVVLTHALKGGALAGTVMALLFLGFISVNGTRR
jgi:hypothetical protein